MVGGMKKLLTVATLVACLLAAAPAQAKVIGRADSPSFPTAFFVTGGTAKAPTALLLRVHSETEQGASIVVASVVCTRRGEERVSELRDQAIAVPSTTELVIPFRRTPDKCGVLVAVRPDDPQGFIVSVVATS